LEASGSPTTNADGFGLNVAITADTQGGTNGTYLLKLGDTATATGDAGVKALAVRNEGGSQLADGNGEASGVAVNRTGALYVTMNTALSGNSSGGKDFVADEDSALLLLMQLER
jgi:hypothetical protein